VTYYGDSGGRDPSGGGGYGSGRGGWALRLSGVAALLLHGDRQTQTVTRLPPMQTTKKPAIYSIAGFKGLAAYFWWGLRGSNPRQTD
jgi:hypothetical protein